MVARGVSVAGLRTAMRDAVEVWVWVPSTQLDMWGMEEDIVVDWAWDGSVVDSVGWCEV